jgi:hypothetical protein
VTTDTAHPSTVIAWRMGRLPLAALWWDYLACFGNRSRADLADYLDGGRPWPDAEHNVLAQVLNEALWDVGCPSLAAMR